MVHLLALEHRVVDGRQAVTRVGLVGGQVAQDDPDGVAAESHSIRRRSDTGMAATSGFSGRAPRSSMYCRRAPEHIASMTSFIVAPAALPTALMRSSGQPCAAKRRAPVIGTLNIDRGAWNDSVADCSRNASFTSFAVAEPKPRTSLREVGDRADRVERRRRTNDRRRRTRPCARLGDHTGRTSMSDGSSDSEFCSSRSADTPSSSAWCDLGVRRETVALQALHQRELPHGTVPVEQVAVQPGRQLEQLANPARAGQTGQSHVVLEVELVVVAPRELADAADRPARPAPEQRPHVHKGQQLPVELADVVGTRTVRQLEQLQPTDVHRVLPRLGEQEHRIRHRHDGHREPPAAPVPDRRHPSP